MKFINKPFSLLLLLILGLCLAPVIRSANNQPPVADDDDDDDAVVNEDVPVTGGETQTAAETEADEEAAEDRITASPFVKANVLFVQPESSSELPAGRLVRMLVGFHNNGSGNFLVEAVDGAFRYPQDYSYYIQNFTAFEFNKVVEASKEATFEYMFTPSETFSQRQFGLTINLRYRNAEGKLFVNSVFNDTITVVEPEEGLDGETFFLYIFLAALIALVLFALQHFFSIFSKKRRVPTKHHHKVQSNGGNGNANYGNGSGTDDVDFEWIPKEHLQPNKSPRQSPRKRTTRAGGSDDDEQ